jgi:predicted amidohydrolase
MTTMRVAAVQLNSGDDPAANRRAAGVLIEQAARAGARLVVLPETWPYLGAPAGVAAVAETLDGPTAAWLAGQARRLGIYLHGGSIFERAEDGRRVHNTTLVFDPAGDLIARYRKIHLYDVDFAGQFRVMESDSVAPGDEVVTATVDGVTVGLSICYDLRFPELYRLLALAGATVLVVPAAFFLHTGRDHWEVLLRARAIENQAYVVAAAHVGSDPGGQRFGRSMVIDPWGTVLAQAPDRPGVVTADLDLAALERIRRELPALANRRPAAYRWPEPALLA